MDKPSLINKIKTLDGLTNNEKADLINLLNDTKQYGLVWEDKPEDVERDMLTMLPVLQEVPERRILAKDFTQQAAQVDINPIGAPELFDDPGIYPEESPSPSGEGRGGVPNHILIEGDNLHALTALTFTHEGRIDVMYFDPPYNTGKKDFRYNDHFVDKEDTYRHSKWLSFMQKRLNIAHRLLNEKGILFISIDDNESAQLKLLLDEIFNESNLIAEFIHKNNSNKNQAKLVGISTEYMYCYAKDKSQLKGLEWKVSKKGAKEVALVFKRLKKQGLSLDEIDLEIKLMYQRPKYSHLSRWNKVNEIGVFKDADLSREGGPKDYTINHPETGTPCTIPDRGWGKSYDELIRLQKENLIWYGDEGTPPGMIDYITSDDLTVPDSFLYFDNSIDTKWQKDVFGKLIFDNPKPLEMIKMVIELQTKKDLTILDMFAGSGTTLHAAIELNNEDRGNRQCILVTNNENNICEEVTYERNKRVIQGYTNTKGMQVSGLTNNNLRYYKTAFVSRERTTKNKKQLTLLATELLCIKEDIYSELTRINDFIFDPKTARCFSDKGRFLLVIYDEEIIEQLVPVITGIDTKSKIKVYVFAPGQYPFTEEFEEVLHKVELGALPDAIYKAYLNVLPKKSDRRFADEMTSAITEPGSEEETEQDLFTDNTPES